MNNLQSSQFLILFNGFEDLSGIFHFDPVVPAKFNVSINILA